MSRHCETMVGISVRNQQNIDEKYLCKICSLILRESVQLNCGHRYCISCVESKIQGAVVKCQECLEETNQNEVVRDRGFERDIKTLFIPCSLCDWNGFLKNYEDHLEKDHPNPLCQYCDRQFESTNQLTLHQASDCDKITVSCPLAKYGCSSSVLRVDMSQHYITEEHQSAIIAFLCRGSSKLVTDQPEGGSEMDVDNLPHTTTTLFGSTNAQLREADETIDAFTGGVSGLSEDAQQLHAEAMNLKGKMDALEKDFDKVKVSVQEQNTYLDGLRPNQEVIAQEVASLKQKIEDLRFVSYDGTYTWKIPDFAEKMADAQSDQQTSIYSPPFYSSPTGYKMRARLYLQGDGNARRTHVSLFFVLMRSDYDAILKFPFNYKVTFCVYDQSGTQKHIIDSFRSDPKSSSFQRPRSEMNIASGIPKFCPLQTIQQEGNPYIRDNTMFIKILVDFGNTSKALLEYALSVNPGLPTHVQQQIVQEEKEKWAQHTLFLEGCWHPGE